MEGGRIFAAKTPRPPRLEKWSLDREGLDEEVGREVGFQNLGWVFMDEGAEGVAGWLA